MLYQLALNISHVPVISSLLLSIFLVVLLTLKERKDERKRA